MKTKPGWFLYATSGVQYAYIKDLDFGIFTKLYVSLLCEFNKKNNTKLFYLELSTSSEDKIDIKKGSPLLLKMADNSVITLKNSSYYAPDYSARFNDYYTSCDCLITNAQLNTIRNTNTIKLRIMSVTKRLDYNLPVDNFRNAINSCYDILIKEIDKKQTGLYDNF